MGTLRYGVTEYELEDRVLAHIQSVVSMKLRRGEPFFLSWQNPGARGAGRQSVWIDNGLPLAFEYGSATTPELAREWLETLSASALTSYGLQITDEQGRPINVPTDAAE